MLPFKDIVSLTWPLMCPLMSCQMHAYNCYLVMQDATPGAAASLPPSGGVGAAPPPVPAREEGGDPHQRLHFLPSNRLYERLNRYR